MSVEKISLNEPLEAERFTSWNLRPERKSCIWVTRPEDKNTMMWQLVLRNLFHRPMRTLIGVMAVCRGGGFWSCLIVGLTSGILQETAKRLEGIGADIMVQSPAAQDAHHFSGSPMPIKIADKLAELKYVQAVARRSCSSTPRAAWRPSGACMPSRSATSPAALFFLQRGVILQDPDAHSRR